MTPDPGRVDRRCGRRRGGDRPPLGRRPARPWIRLVALALPLGLGAAGSWVGAFAAWSSSVPATSTMSTGRIDLTVEGSDGPTVVWSGLTVAGLLPSDVVHARLTLANTGTVPLRWSLAVTAAGSTALAAALVVGVRIVPTAACTSVTYASGSALVTGAPGLTAVAAGPQSLAAGGTVQLCFEVSLPAGAPSSLQGAAVTPSVVVSATS